jgi:hypothetical protein
MGMNMLFQAGVKDCGNLKSGDPLQTQVKLVEYISSF